MEQEKKGILIERVYEQTGIAKKNIETVLELTQEGNTIPFIARYRKELTGNMDEVQIKRIVDMYEHTKNLSKRKEEVKRLISERATLTKELEDALEKATTVSEIEDIFKPYKEKKKTRATEARRKGLEPLARFIKEGRGTYDMLQKEAQQYYTDEVTSYEEALQGACDIVAEEISDTAFVNAFVRENMLRHGRIQSKLKKNAEDAEHTYRNYYDFESKIVKLSSYQTLALNRGEREKILTIKCLRDEAFIETRLAKRFVRSTTLLELQEECLKDALKRLVYPSIDREIRSILTEEATQKAVEIFEKNLEQLLLTPPLKSISTLAIDPAYRTGCKFVVLDSVGNVQTKGKIYLKESGNKEYHRAEEVLHNVINTYAISLICIGNGTASRETEMFIIDTCQKFNVSIPYIIVNESGASVYSASALARDEFPEYEVEERSAVSIGRRVLDPLSELVKIDPESIGVGQYQHDVNQKYLKDQLAFVIMKIVNQVGVDVNKASAKLLSYVSGITPSVAQNIVTYRQENGAFSKRSQLQKVPRFGAKMYEQSAGFLRILDGSEPLDATGIHPESYDAARTIITYTTQDMNTLGTKDLREALQTLDVSHMASEIGIGEYTIQDIIDILSYPTRDPRDQYPQPKLKKGILSFEDIEEGMELEGTVRNIVEFGAFVDVGLKNDGLIHISKLSSSFVRNPLDVISIGDIVKTRVLSIDHERKKVSLERIEESSNEV